MTPEQAAAEAYAAGLYETLSGEHLHHAKLMRNGFLVGVAWAREQIKPATSWWTEHILALDGVAAVNLAEPSEGDLARVVAAYGASRKRIAELEAQLAEVTMYIPKVPTEPYEKQMAKRIAELEAALWKIATSRCAWQLSQKIANETLTKEQTK